MDVRLPDGRILRGVPEGTTKAQIEAKLAQKPALDHVPQSRKRDLVSDLNQGANLGISYLNSRTFGIGPKVGSAIGAGIAYPLVAGIEALQGDPIPSYGDLYKQGVENVQGKIKQSREDNPYLTAGAEILGGIKTGKDFARTKAGKSVSDWVGAGKAAKDATLGQKAVSLSKRVGKGALVGEAAYRAYKIGNAAPGEEGDEAVSGVPIGGIFGGAAPLLSAGYGSAKGALTPAIEDTKKPLIDLAKKYNVPLGIDDLTESKFYKTLVSEGETIPFSGAAKNFKAQQYAYNRAVSKTFGQESDRITPDVISKGYEDLGKKFQSFTEGRRFQPAEEFYTSIDDIVNKASLGHYGKDGAEFVKPNLDRIRGLMDENGLIKGERLDKLRREFAEISRSRYDDVGKLNGDLEELLVDIISDNDPEIAKAITEAKYQYKNLKTVQGLALKDQVDGNIRPALLTQAVKNKYGESALAKGEAGELGDLARIGQLIKDKVPNSGTSQRTMARNLLTGNAGTIPFGFAVNPVLGSLQLGATGLAMTGNRVLQNKNVDQELIEALVNKAPSTAMRLPSGVTTGNMADQFQRYLSNK